MRQAGRQARRGRGGGRALGEKAGGVQRTLTVMGHGSVRVPPDEALVALSVRAELAASARVASAQTRDALERVLAALKAHGIVERQIHTTRLQIAPEYHHDERGPQPVQYRVSSAVHVIVEDLPKLGELLDALMEAGGDDMKVQGVGLLARDTGAAAAQARSAAFALARQKAQQIAQDAGERLGELLSITEEMGGEPAGMYHAGMGVAYYDATAIRREELEVSAALEVVWALA